MSKISCKFCFSICVEVHFSRNPHWMDELGEREHSWDTHLLHMKTPEGELFWWIHSLEVDQNRFSVFFLFVWHVQVWIGLLGLQEWCFAIGIKSNHLLPLKLFETMCLTIVVSSVAVFQRLGGRFNYWGKKVSSTDRFLVVIMMSVWSSVEDCVI